MVDCSHGNSNKDYTRQAVVLENIAQQIEAGTSNIMGVMLESHLVAGNQSIDSDRSSLVYGQSITDACIDWATTEKLLHTLANSVAKGRPAINNNQVSVASN